MVVGKSVQSSWLRVQAPDVFYRRIARSSAQARTKTCARLSRQWPQALNRVRKNTVMDLFKRLDDLYQLRSLVNTVLDNLIGCVMIFLRLIFSWNVFETSQCKMSWTASLKHIYPWRPTWLSWSLRAGSGLESSQWGSHIKHITRAVLLCHYSDGVCLTSTEVLRFPFSYHTDSYDNQNLMWKILSMEKKRLG